MQTDKFGNPREVIYGGDKEETPPPPLSEVEDNGCVADQPSSGPSEHAGNDGHGSGTAEEDLANMPSLIVISLPNTPYTHSLRFWRDSQCSAKKFEAYFCAGVWSLRFGRGH